MKLTKEQKNVVTSTAPTLIVLGGAGTGKTTTAARVARKTLQDAEQQRRRERVLFLSFSRAATTQVLSRSADILAGYASRIDVTTFHAFAWRLIERWGHVLGIDEPVLLSPAERKVFGASEGLVYDDLIPLAQRLLDVPAIHRHLQRRWSLIVIDEFQDTNDHHWALIETLAEHARLVLLGDLNQCIYRNLPNSSGVGPRRVATAMARIGATTIELPDVSHRDPTHIIPAAANAIRDRKFKSDAVRTAIDAGMIEIIREPQLDRQATVVVEQIAQLRELGHSVGVFSHHVDSTAQLSDELNEAGVAHEVVGLPDAVAAALRAQYAMLAFCCREAEVSDLLRALAIFVASAERGNEAPELARMVAGLRPRPASLTERLDSLGVELGSVGSLREGFRIASAAYDFIGLKRGASAWQTAARLMSSLLGPRALSVQGLPVAGVRPLRSAIDQEHLSLLTYDRAQPAAEVELMGLYQTKGREVDAAIVLLRSTDWYGREREPMSDGSKLLYVLMTRARKKTVVLSLGDVTQPLVLPLVSLS
ncbi:UvrD-helicase domain-containing protein [Microbacterium sp. K24]|uniref:UvrD-helicase domain-containing protein n=1 Tax=Microbacterium sp. K24 TaxID=2305446 RepID=UPI00144423A1|nr:UvrD-helicase domain-containing protein [Microbacterium sp. K24]